VSSILRLLKSNDAVLFLFLTLVAVVLSLTFLSEESSAFEESSSVRSIDWDIDNDGRADALTDGLLFLRFTFGLRGNALTNSLLSDGSEFTSASDIERELQSVYDASGDIDGDGNIDALTDGLLLLRYLFGLSGESLISGVVANGAIRTDGSSIGSYIGTLMPEAPYITLNGSAELNHEQATTYVDAGATASDFKDGSVMVIVTGSVDADEAGVYTLTYSATDSDGNIAKPVTRTITVADTVGPVISINGEASMEINQDSDFSDPGATATDAVDGSVRVVTTGSVDPSTAGTYTLTYNAADSAGNSAYKTRSVTVKFLSFWPLVENPINLDVESRVSEILDDMSLDEKIGQMVQAEIGSVSASDVGQYNLGSVLNGGGSWPNGKQSSINDWVSLADSYFLASTDQSDGGAGIPVIWGTDAVHGHNNVIGATIFPHNIGLGATNNSGLIREIGEITALEVAVTGIDWVFSPVAAVVRNDRWGRSYEGYSEDPEIVEAYLDEMVRGLQGAADSDHLFGPDKVVATAKHFIGDGGTTNGTDQGNTEVTETELRDIHGRGYISALGAGVQTIMATYNSWNGTKVHGSRELLTDVLKQQMGFDGFVIGDWNGHAQVPGCSNGQCAAAINAGVDMIMVPNDWRDFVQNTRAQVNEGTISMSRIDDAVTRILRVKARTGLLDQVKPSERSYANIASLIGASEHRAVARRAVRESLVLLKNKNAILPLSRNLNVLVAGSGADNIAQQSGGWTVTWQGTGNSNSDFPGGTSIYDGIHEAVTSGGGSAELSTSGNFNGPNPDVAIVIFGETPYAEGNGDISSLEYQPANKSDLALLKSLKDQEIPVVSIFISGRPMWVNPELNSSEAFVAAWLPGSEGVGVADVIFKNNDGTINYDFKGKLSFSWPKASSQFELNRNDASYDPLFPYGFGLTYNDTDTLGDDLDESGSTGGPSPITHPVPGLIQAEEYSAMDGIQTETTSDVGGGSNIGYVDSGDWIEYKLNVSSAGSYLFEYRVASLGGSSGFEVLVDGIKMDSQNIPNTGGWQSWMTNSAVFDLTAGNQVLRINALGGSWNLNWINIVLQ
jgi:beta-glucosidase